MLCDNASADVERDRKDRFLIEEYKALREEIDDRVAEHGRLLQFTVSRIGAVYAWLAKDGLQADHLWHGLLGTIAMAAFAIIRSRSNYSRLLEIGDYICDNTEKHFRVTHGRPG